VFDVYVVGSTEPGSEGLDKLAEAMSARYGLPLEDLRGRLARGRFRVKGNVDRPTAEAYAKDLAAIMGKCSIETASGGGSGGSIPPMNTSQTPRTGATSTPPAGVYQSGLSAAFSAPSIPVADLGALGREDSFALASLDGHDGGEAYAGLPAPTPAFEPPPAPAPPPKRTSSPSIPAKTARPRDVPVELDPFKPPDAEDDDRPVEIAADEIEHRARKRVSTPPASEAIQPPPEDAPRSHYHAPASPQQQAQPQPAPQRRSSASISPIRTAATPAGPVAIVRPPGRLGPLGDERVRLVAGVVLAILIGFLPAHLVANMRERAAYQRVDALVEQKQADATAQEDYDALDAFRARELDDKRGSHRSIMLMAFVIWGAVGGAVAYGWFKRVPWDSLE
jgi:hypothetical protein